MAAGTFVLYDQAKVALLEEKMNLSSDNFNIILVSSSYTPAVATDATYADVSAHEATGTGYTAGGITAGSDSVTLSGNTVTVKMGDASWPSSTITATYAVFVRRAGTTLASTDLLLGYFELDSGGAAISSTNGTFEAGPGASGLFTFT